MSIETPPHLPFFEPFEDGQVAIANRGGSFTHENTWLAFYEAVARFSQHDLPQYAEVGVQAVGDTALVFHTYKSYPQYLAIKAMRQTLDLTGRRTNLHPVVYRKRFSRMSLAEAEEAASVNDAPVLTLPELLEEFPNMRLFIDPKTDATADPVAKAIIDAKVWDRVCIDSPIGSRDDKIIHQIQAKNNNQPVARTMSRRECTVALGLLAHARYIDGDYSLVKSYIASIGASATLASHRISPDLIETFRDRLGVPIIGAITHPQKVSDEKITGVANKGFDAVLGRPIGALAAAVAKTRSK